MDNEETSQNEYQIFLNIDDILGIDRVKGSFCIREVNGKEFLGSVGPREIIEFVRAKKLGDMTEENERDYRKSLFGNFNPELPLICTIDYPCKETVFEIKPYVEKGNDFELKYFPVGYVAWQIGKKYQELYKDPEANGIWGHDIEDLHLGTITLEANNVISIDVGS